MEWNELEIYREYARRIGHDWAEPKGTAGIEFTSIETLAQHYRTFLFDGFGTLYNLTEAHPDSQAMLQFLRDQGCTLRLVTNAASRDPHLLQQHLLTMGIYFQTSEIISSGSLLAAHNKNLQIKAAFHLGNKSAECFLSNAGIELMESPTEPTVVLSSSVAESHPSLSHALSILQRPKARLIVINPDAYAPKLDGTRIPVSGSQAWALHKNTGCELVCLGKPFPEIFNAALANDVIHPDRAIMIGDTLGTDIMGAQGLGLATALVVGGNSSLELIESDETALGLRPDYYIHPSFR